MPDIAAITLITINPIDNMVTVRASIVRDDGTGDEFAKRTTQIEQTFTFAEFAAVNVTQSTNTMDGREFLRGAKKSAQKSLRQFFNGKTGAIASAITNLDANG